jgi:hypothetical protein
LEGPTAEHKTDPFNELIFHEAEVFFFHRCKDLPHFICQHFTHERQDLSQNEVLVDKEKEETFRDGFLLYESEAGVSTSVLRFEYFLSSRLKELCFLNHLIVEISHFSRNIDVVLTIDAQVFQPDLLVLILGIWLPPKSALGKGMLKR